jgi:hypothetical protein
MMIRIFAFDVLILNANRKKEKPNLLVHNGKPYLIDNENILDFTNNKPCNEFDELDLNFSIKGEEMNHIFLESLREKYKNNLINFDNLLCVLQSINPKILKIVILYLPADRSFVKYNFSGKNQEYYESITKYLEIVQKSPNKFIQLIKKLLM